MESSDSSSEDKESLPGENINNRHSDWSNEDEVQPSGGKSNCGISNTVSKNIIWSKVPVDFMPRKTLQPAKRDCMVMVYINHASSELDIFMKLFLISLFIYISQCINMRINMYNSKKQKNVPSTDEGEIMIVLGVSLIMCYNQVLDFSSYSSMNKLLGMMQ